MIEITLSRVWQQATEPDRQFAIITAFRRVHTREKNLARNKSLGADLTTAGFGFWVLDGHWIENRGTPGESDASEDAFFVSSDGTQREFCKILQNLIVKYEQEACIIRLPGDVVRLFTADGNNVPLGKFDPQRVAKDYSRIRTDGGTFTFETAGEAGGFARALINQLQERYPELKRHIAVMDESTLSRVWQQATEPGRQFAIITAFRGEDPSKNLARNRSLGAELRNAGLGHWVLRGHWLEKNPDSGKETDVAEDSLFVSGDGAGFSDLILSFAQKYGQEAVLIRKPNDVVCLVRTDGSDPVPLGEFNPQKIGQFYSRLRRDVRTFVFESAKPAANNMKSLLDSLLERGPKE